MTTLDALLQEVKVALRVSSTMTDAEVRAWVEAALADMRRVGVDPALIDPDQGLDPLCKAAVLLYAKGMYGFDNSEASRFLESYRLIVAELINSPSTYRGGDGA